MFREKEMESPNSKPPWLVLKFGGTSVSTPERWRTIREIVQERRDEGYRVLLVCSALSQVSNRLEKLLQDAAAGSDTSEELGCLWQIHEDLAARLGAGLDSCEEIRDELEDLLEGVRLTREITPRTQARVLSCGELLSTRIGVQFLDQGRARWIDAREQLEAEPVDDPRDPSGRPYLSATCSNEPSESLQGALDTIAADVFVTQGFIARRDGETVLLGRGGSDTSGAYFAGMLEAERLEIWTDVPGLFSANPHQVGTARLLDRLPYRVAEEIAMRGAKVVHPAAIRAAESASVPVHVRWTDHPDVEGTVIDDMDPGSPVIHAVAMRRSMAAISMRVDTDWQPIGLIADLTACFKERGLSIDLLASSPTNLTVCIDLQANHVELNDLGPLMADLRRSSRPRLISGTATVSLVGTGMRSLLHEWAEALKCFEDEDVLLISQAANDRSVSFLVPDDAAERIVATLHETMLEGGLRARSGETWQTLSPN